LFKFLQSYLSWIFFYAADFFVVDRHASQHRISVVFYILIYSILCEFHFVLENCQQKRRSNQTRVSLHATFNAQRLCPASLHSFEPSKNTEIRHRVVEIHHFEDPPPLDLVYEVLFRKPAASSQQPAASSQQPAARSQQPAASNQATNIGH
jgi:hypothetical protein